MMPISVVKAHFNQHTLINERFIPIIDRFKHFIVSQT